MWEITKDIIDKGKAVGVCSCNRSDSKTALLHRFRLLDDDGLIYYEGISDDDSSFAPLDDFGEANAGCTEIHYLSGNTWKQL